MWCPHLTVALVVEQQNKFLMVNERKQGRLLLNQPAGHLEENETLIEAAVRETLEETAYKVSVKAYLGVSQYFAPNGEVYIRHSFIGELLQHDAERKLDKDIEEALWLSKEEIDAARERWRSPMVGTDIEKYLARVQLPLSSVSIYR